MAIADAGGLPLAVAFASASSGEVTLVDYTLNAHFLAEAPARLIGDKASDSDRLFEGSAAERDIELIASNRSGRAGGRG